MDMQSYKERVKDWRDFDYATWELGVLLGLLPEWGAPQGDPWHGLKGVVWSANPTSEMLSAMMMQMVEAGALLRNEEGQFKWNPDFKIREE